MVAGNEKVESFKDRWEITLARIDRAARRAGRDPSAIKLIAATKSVPVRQLQDAFIDGCRSFAENRVQEALTKMEALGSKPGLEWHLIGPLQSNKVKLAVGRFVLIHAVDRLEVAQRVDAIARERSFIQPVLLEVNVAGEKTKHGFSPSDLMAQMDKMQAYTGIHIRGLMAVPPFTGSQETARPYFRFLRKLSDEVDAKKFDHVTMQELSMGMSEDFESAVEEGATIVRIGTALFGSRPYGDASRTMLGPRNVRPQEIS